MTNVDVNNVIRLPMRPTKATDENSGCDRRFRNSESDFQRKKNIIDGDGNHWRRLSQERLVS